MVTAAAKNTNIALDTARRRAGTSGCIAMSASVMRQEYDRAKQTTDQKVATMRARYK